MYLYVIAEQLHGKLRCVICPFCEISSCDVAACVFKNVTYFSCDACGALAFAKSSFAKVNAEYVQKIYPNIDISTTIWQTEFYFITGITSAILAEYKSLIDVKPDDVIKFSKENYDYVQKTHNKSYISYQENEILCRSDLAKKYSINLVDGNELSIPVNSFNVSKPELKYPKNMCFYCRSIYFWTYKNNVRFGIMWFSKKMQTW